MDYCPNEEEGGLTLVANLNGNCSASSACSSAQSSKASAMVGPTSQIQSPNTVTSHDRSHSNHSLQIETDSTGKAAGNGSSPVFISDFCGEEDEADRQDGQVAMSPAVVSPTILFEQPDKNLHTSTNTEEKGDSSANIGVSSGSDLSPPASATSIEMPSTIVFEDSDEPHALPMPLASKMATTVESSMPGCAAISYGRGTTRRSTPPPTTSVDNPSISYLFNRQFSVNDRPMPQQVVGSSFSTPQLERAWRHGSDAPSLSQYGFNNMANGRLLCGPTVTSCSTSSLYGLRLPSCATGFSSRIPISAGMLTPSTSSTTPLNVQQSPFFAQNGCKTHATGSSDQSCFIGSSTGASTPALRHNKSRSNFASLNPMDDETDKTFYIKQVASEYGLAKHLHTEHVMSKHSLKGKMTKFQRLFDRAFTLINLDTEDAVVEGAAIVAKVMINAWVVPKIGHDLAYGLCDYLREMGYVDLLLQFYMSPDSKHRVRMAAGRALEECLSGPNRDYVVEKDLIDQLVAVALNFKAGELFESLFKQSPQTNARLIELGALDYVLAASNKASTAPGGAQLFRHAALALANLSMYSENECQQKMIAKNVPDWLFLLASSQDDVTRYYACMAICALVSNKEIETAVIKSGTLSLVEPFLLAHKPADFANADYRHNQGRPREWLEKLIPLLSAKRREPRSITAFHFAMEAGIKKEQDQLEVFEEIGATEALKQVASYPEEVGPKFTTLALEIIGAEVPYKLMQQVPLWSVEDVQYWVTQIGFEPYAQSFADQKVDGDILLLLTNAELEHDINMKSGLLRKRFMRELESLKMSADYSCVDETQLDKFLVSISPQFSVYTYQLLEKGADRSILPSMSDEVLKNDLGIRNPIDRIRLIQALEECKHIDDMEIAILSRHIDIFISYRRSTGNQLASLIKVLLQLRGYKVFIDVDRLYAGKFDLSLLKNIQAAKHFILVLTPQALQRCIGDEECHDWVHEEVLCALEHNKNVIPILDPQFEWPEESSLPQDIRVITRFNGVRWVHNIRMLASTKFIKGEFNMNRGFYPHQDRNKRLVNFRGSSSKQNSSGGSHSSQMTPSQSISDNLIDTLSNHRSRAASREELNTVISPSEQVSQPRQPTSRKSHVTDDNTIPDGQSFSTLCHA